MRSNLAKEPPDVVPPGVTRIRAEDLPKRTKADLERLAELAAMDDADIDLSDAPEFGGVDPAKHPIRAALARAMGRQHMGRVALWEAAKLHLPSLTQEEVIQYLKGDSAVRADVINALVLAAGLRVVVDEAEQPAKLPDARVA